MSAVVWLHGDALGPRNPALTACPGAPAIFVFDEALLVEQSVSLKRIVFLYECLLELPVVIRRGDVAVEVLAFAQAHGASEVVTSATPSPRFERIRRVMAAQLVVHVCEPEPFVRLEQAPDLKRFSRYWRAVATEAMRPPRRVVE